MGKRSVGAEDIFRLALVGDVVMHPDGQRIAVTVTTMDSEVNQYRSHIWNIHTPSGDTTPFTTSTKSESSPQWSADGRWLAFLSNRHGDKQQVYVMSSHGGEAQQVTELRNGVQMFRWRPDSKSIAVVGNALTFEKDERAWKKAEDKPPRERYTDDVLVIRRTWYRMDGVGFFGDHRNHLFVVNLQAWMTPWKHNLQPATVASDVSRFPVYRVTEGQFDVDSFDWSPDGQHIVFASNLDENADDTMHRFLYRIPISVPEADTATAIPLAQAERLFATPRSVEHPRYSPDGRYIAFYGNDLEHAFYTQNQVWVYDVITGETQCLTDHLDEAFGDVVVTDTRTSAKLDLIWAEHSRYVYSTVSHRGTTQLVRIHCRTKQVEWLTNGDHCVYAYTLNRRGSTAAIVKGTPTDPGNVFALEIPAATAEACSHRRLTNWNAEWLKEVELTPPQRFSFVSDGIEMDGWVMLPASADTKHPLPTVVQVHGGPMAMYANSFFFEFQLLAASGMAVVYGNPRGSMGYGQEFCSCIRGAWGDRDFRDVEACIDTALEKFPLDARRLAIAGGSYGGFMAAWAIGHTERYKAAVVMRSCVNEYSMFGSCDIGFLDELDFGCKPWENPEPYFAVSPIAAADKMRASVLIIHSENDLRCPIEQAEQLYAALRAHCVPVEFVRFPNESHGLSRSGQPWHRVFRLEKIQSFLKEQL